jgi:hypothetical protein
MPEKSAVQALEAYEARLATLEALGLTDEEREINDLIFRIVRWLKTTLWVTNGAVKYFGPPIGIGWGLYLYGANLANGIAYFIMGTPK